jgi:hypothetical protein
MNYLTVFVHFMTLCVCECVGLGVESYTNQEREDFSVFCNENSQLAGNICDTISLLSDCFVECDTLRRGNLANSTWKCVGNFELACYCLRFYA